MSGGPNLPIAAANMQGRGVCSEKLNGVHSVGVTQLISSRLSIVQTADASSLVKVENTNPIAYCCWCCFLFFSYYHL